MVKRRSAQVETQEQLALMHWARLYQGDYPALMLLCHIPNGGKRNIAEAVKFKAMGVRAGMPDLFLPWAAHGFHGWFCEMKAPGGRIRPVQREVIKELRERGYCAFVCEGWLAAATSLQLYLDETLDFGGWYDRARRNQF